MMALSSRQARTSVGSDSSHFYWRGRKYLVIVAFAHGGDDDDHHCRAWLAAAARLGSLVVLNVVDSTSCISFSCCSSSFDPA